MLLSERRKQYRRILEGNVCIHPASVFDAMSARMAASLGFEVGMFAGSIASGTVLGAPDLVVLTLTEFAEQIRRITRGSDLPLMVDADHGYGDALNVMRTVEELETSGVAALTIEDTVLPMPFGRRGDGLVSVEEMLGKLRGAVAARQDPALVVIGRTGALRHGGVAEAVKCVKAYTETGIDAIFLAGASSREEVEAMHRVTRLPLMLGGAPPALSDRNFLASQGVRIALQGHHPFYAAAKAVYDTLKYLREGGAPGGLKDRVASEELLAIALKQNDYKRWQGDFLRERDALAVEAVRRDRGIELVQDVRVGLRGMEVGVARPSARTARHGRRSGRHQSAAGGVDREDERRVEALVGHEDEAGAAVEHDVVRMRAGLFRAMRPRLARQRRPIGDRPQRAVHACRQQGHRARRGVGADHQLATALHPR